jgi:hypothetical protein
MDNYTQNYVGCNCSVSDFHIEYLEYFIGNYLYLKVLPLLQVSSLVFCIHFYETEVQILIVPSKYNL